MPVPSVFLVVDAAAIEGGLYVEFADGEVGLYAGSFLRSYISFAKQLDQFPPISHSTTPS